MPSSTVTNSLEETSSVLIENQYQFENKTNQIGIYVCLNICTSYSQQFYKVSLNLFHIHVFTLEEVHNTENTTFTHSQIYSFALSPLLRPGTQFFYLCNNDNINSQQTKKLGGVLDFKQHHSLYVVVIFFKLLDGRLFH